LTASSGKSLAEGPVRDEKALRFFQFLWDVYVGKAASAGVDLPTAVREWIARQRRTIADECGAGIEFDSLIQARCHPAMLAVLIGALHFAPRAAGLRNLFFGSPRLRGRVVRSANRTAVLLEKMFPPQFEDAEAKARVEAEGVLAPSTVIGWLNGMSDTLSFLDNLPRMSGVRTIEEAVRFFLCAYVKDATGKWHDAEIAALAGCALGSLADETAQRMWRLRNFPRLAKALERPRPLALILAEFLDSHVT
jgi:hypothetical protein